MTSYADCQGDGAEVHRGALRLVTDLAGIGRDEDVLLVADDASDSAALGAVSSALEARAASVVRVDSDAFVRRELPETEAVVVSLARPLLTHTDALRARLAAGARYVNLRGLDPALLRQAGEVDFDAVAEMTRSLAEVLSTEPSVRVTEDQGTDLTVELAGDALALGGLAREPGSIGGFPGGEAAIVPKAGSAHGVIRGPGFIEGFRGDTTGCVIHVSAGVIEALADPAASRYLRAQCGDSIAGRTLGEFGLGTNAALTPSSPRTAKKRLGTAHVGIGDNRSFGGAVVADNHIDVIALSPTVTTPHMALIEAGRMVWRP